MNSLEQIYKQIRNYYRDLKKRKVDFYMAHLHEYPEMHLGIDPQFTVYKKMQKLIDKSWEDYMRHDIEANNDNINNS